MSEFKSGFVALCGRPNVGKSTLLNLLVGQKIAIVSPRPQTTRNTIRGILTEKDYQIVFLDTPGIHRPKSKLNEYMMRSQQEAVKGTDIVVIMINAAEKIGHTDIAALRQYAGKNAVVVLNKIDIVSPEEIKEKIDTLISYDMPIIPISAETGEGKDALLDMICSHLTAGPKYFPDDMVCDFPEKFLAGEIIREKALLLLEQEVPHGIGVAVTQMKERADGKLYIAADVYCERDSHKGIIIGKKGAMLKQIGTLAREEMEALFEADVFLELFVRVKENWRNSGAALKELGYRELF